MNYYSFHIGDYASATRHLSWIEDAAYRRLLDVYYVHETPLPADLRKTYRLVLASTDEQREAVDIVLGEFFTLTDEGYRHDRCDAEIWLANDKKNKASQSAQERWRIAREKELALQLENARNADAMRTHQIDHANASETTCEGNAPNPNPNPNKKQNPHAQAREAASPDGFAEFWLSYPKKVGKGAAEAAWKKLHPPTSVVIAAIAAQRNCDQWRRDGGQYVPNPATWLNQRRWEDGAEATIPVSADGKPYRDPMIYGFDTANGDPLPDGWILPPTGETRYMPGFGWVLSPPRRVAA